MREYDIVKLPEPRTDEEEVLIMQIEAIQKEYRKAIQPYVDRLVEIENRRVPRYVVVPKSLQDKDAPETVS